MIKLCRVCNRGFKPTEYQIKKSEWRCLNCRRAYEKEWRIKRHKEGFKTGGEASKEWWIEYNKEYHSRPEVKERKSKQMREYRKNPELRIKMNARWMANKAVLSGKLIKKPCEVCGNIKVDGHHKDYFKPLEVVWLCRKCHLAEHAKEKDQ